VLKSFAPKFHQRYKNYWEIKQEENKRRFFQDLEPIGSSHLENTLIGRNVDLDLLFIFPQKRGKVDYRNREKWKVHQG
jgi:hypothetical protein